MNGSSFPATMERGGGSGCGNKVTPASCRHCMAELSRTELLYAQGVCGCVHAAGRGWEEAGKTRSSTPSRVLKGCRMGSGSCWRSLAPPPFSGWDMDNAHCAPSPALPPLHSLRGLPPVGNTMAPRPSSSPVPPCRRMRGEKPQGELLFPPLGHPLPFLRDRKGRV